MPEFSVETHDFYSIELVVLLPKPFGRNKPPAFSIPAGFYKFLSQHLLESVLCIARKFPAREMSLVSHLKRIGGIVSTLLPPIGDKEDFSQGALQTRVLRMNG